MRGNGARILSSRELDDVREWILAHHERTGNPNDQIVRFDAYVIWQDSPKPGEPPVPTNIRKRRFLHFPENAP